MISTNSPLILDACCILNFYSSSRFADILDAIPTEVYVSEVVLRKELLSLQAVDQELGFANSQFDDAITRKSIFVTDFITDFERETFINYAMEMKDDGESATFAIASNRNWSTATDDRRARSFAQRNTPSTIIFSTLEIVKHWQDTSQADSEELRAVLNNILNIGSYLPGKGHPLYNWWSASI